MQVSRTADGGKPTPHGRGSGGQSRRAPTLLESARTGLAVALVGSVTLAVAEVLLVAMQVSGRLSGENIPVELLIALIGRAACTHALLWCPVMLIVSLGYWGMVGRRRGATPLPVLAGVFVVLALALVIPADLELAGRSGWMWLVGGCVTGVLLGAVKYVCLRSINHKAGPLVLKRLTHAGTALALVVLVVSGVVFVRSPLFDPSTWADPQPGPTHNERSGRNVLWIVLDTARADRMSCHGYGKPTTPFLDEWSRRAVVCDRAISNGMWTVPAHASMLTGLSVREHGTGHRNLWLDDSFRTVADALGESGYATAMFSNNPLVSPDTNLTKGFQSWRIVYRLRQLSRFSLDFLCEKWGITPFLPWLDQDYGGALTNRFVDDWLDAHEGVPKFVFINYMETHLPYRVPRRYRSMFLDVDQVDRSYDLRRRVHGNIVSRLDMDYSIHGSDFLSEYDRDVLRGQYDAAIRYLDDRVREVVEMFKQRGLLDNTLVVIVSDHGEYLGTHGMWGHRFLTYQDLAHVMVQIREPGREQGARISRPVELSDVYDTVLARVLPQPGWPAARDVRDLIAIAESGGEPRIAICECNGPAPITMKNFAGCTDPVVLHRAVPQIAAVSERFKLIKSADGWRELYDLREDPGELRNLIDERPDDAERLAAYIRGWLETTPAYTLPAEGDESPSRKVLESLRSLGYVGDDD